MSESYHGVSARLHSVALQETDQDHLHDQDGVAHADAVARAHTKRHERVWVHLLRVVFTEPAVTEITAIYNPKWGLQETLLSD